VATLSSLITSPHAPFIYPLNWKKVIGLKAVLTCFVSYGSENHSSGVPFLTKDSNFLLRSGWTIYHRSSDCSQLELCRSSSQAWLWKGRMKWTHHTVGTWHFPWINSWEDELWDWTVGWTITLYSSKILTKWFKCSGLQFTHFYNRHNNDMFLLGSMPGLCIFL
jgi:hypothetical protein